jgi:mono/diheme cytochrome c family protein
VQKHFALAGLAAALVLVPCVSYCAETQAAKPAAGKPSAASKQIERGRYLIIVGNCNDCHTAGFAESEGNVAEKDWLMGGGPLGFRGPWGTTYSPNLRLTVAKVSEAQWVTYSKVLKARPPMPWYSLKQWSEPDLRAVYQYIKHLGPAGEPAPPYLPPDKQPNPPYIQWPVAPK